MILQVIEKAWEIIEERKESGVCSVRAVLWQIYSDFMGVFVASIDAIIFGSMLE